MGERVCIHTKGCGNVCVDLPNGGRSVSSLKEKGIPVFKKNPIDECPVRSCQGVLSPSDIIDLISTEKDLGLYEILLGR